MVGGEAVVDSVDNRGHERDDDGLPLRADGVADHDDLRDATCPREDVL